MVLLAILCDTTGAVIMGSAHTFGQIVTGAAISGLGSGVCELSAIAGYVSLPYQPGHEPGSHTDQIHAHRVSEVVPVKHRGYINGIVLFLTLPFCTYNIFGQLVDTGLTWRWGMWISW
jgi:hypothetical protein